MNDLNNVDLGTGNKPIRAQVKIYTKKKLKK